MDERESATIELTARAAPQPRECTPDARRKGDGAGIPVTLADGAEWTLADGQLMPALDDLRDKVFDDVVYSGKVAFADLLEAAYLLLRANYHLANGEVAALLTGADFAALADAVADALLGREAVRRTYTDWVRSCLIANSIDPAKVEPRLLRHVLHQLVATGRAVPLEEFSDMVEAMANRKAMLGT